ncbi:hypothetical protein AAHZ94_34055, partial [Streptomyces sp. HSW2009]
MGGGLPEDPAGHGVPLPGQDAHGPRPHEPHRPQGAPQWPTPPAGDASTGQWPLTGVDERGGTTQASLQAPEAYALGDRLVAPYRPRPVPQDDAAQHRTDQPAPPEEPAAQDGAGGRPGAPAAAQEWPAAPQPQHATGTDGVGFAVPAVDEQHDTPGAPLSSGAGAPGSEAPGTGAAGGTGAPGAGVAGAGVLGGAPTDEGAAGAFADAARGEGAAADDPHGVAHGVVHGAAGPAHEGRAATADGLVAEDVTDDGAAGDDLTAADAGAAGAAGAGAPAVDGLAGGDPTGVAPASAAPTSGDAIDGGPASDVPAGGAGARGAARAGVPVAADGAATEALAAGDLAAGDLVVEGPAADAPTAGGPGDAGRAPAEALPAQHGAAADPARRQVAELPTEGAPGVS